MSGTLYRLGRFAARRPWRVIGVWFAVAVAVIVAAGTVGRQLDDSFAVPGLDSQRAVDLLSAAGADEAGLTAQVVLSPRDDQSFFDSPAARSALKGVERSLVALPNVVGRTDPSASLDASSSEATASGTVSADGRVALVRMQYPVLEELGPGDLANLRNTITEARATSNLQVEGSGDLFFAFDEPETSRGELIGLLAAVAILLVAFGSVVAMGLPIGMALFGLAFATGSLSLVTYLIEIPSWAPVLASMVGLGVGIDYALFLVTRHREHLDAGMGVEESMGRAVATAGQAVVFAGGTVVVSILGLAVAGIPFVTSAGVAIAVTVFVMVAVSITLLPAFLGLAGTRINRVHLRRPHRASRPGAGRHGWKRWATHVGAHALAYAVGATALLTMAAAPVLFLRLGFPDDGTLPVSRTERRAYDLVAEAFGPGANGPLVIAIDITQDPGVVGPLRAAVAGDVGIASVAPPSVDERAGVATLVALPTTAPQDDATYATIERLRTEVFPTVLADSPATAHVGGQTANFSDIGARVKDRLALFIFAVVATSFLLLMIVFRSLLVPLKAALVNLLAIGAAYGVLVMVFQWGWGARLIGVDSPVPIVSFVPMFMFAILFGLSMDYEVFLLSRVREHYVATGDNDAAIVHGLTSTARVITSAALIMVSVFLGFVSGADPTTKMMGLGLATAILVDATLVRMVLVPATMKLLGDANWWLPGWLDRLLPHVHPEGGVGREERDAVDPPRVPALVDGPARSTVG